MPVRLIELPRRSTGLGLTAALVITQLTLGGAWAGSTGHEGVIVYASVPRNGPGADQDSDLWLYVGAQQLGTSIDEHTGGRGWDRPGPPTAD